MLQCRYTDILALCETKLDESFSIGQFDVLGNNCVRRYRSSNGGGLMYYNRSDIPHRRRDDSEQAINDLRDASILETPRAYTTKYGLKSFRNYGAKIWNLYPTVVNQLYLC